MIGKFIQRILDTGLFNLKNIFSFTIIRLLNIFFPLITYKHVLSKVGLNEFGLFASVNAVIIFYAIFTNYGFELTGPIEISFQKSRNDSLLINKVASQILSIKSAITFFAFLSIFPIAYYLEFNVALIVFAFQQIIYETFSLNFLFQGLNQLNILIKVNLISRFISTLLCVYFINDSTDIIMYPLYLGIGNAVALAFSYFIAFRRLNFCFVKFSKDELQIFFAKSSKLYLGNLLGKLYQNGTRFFFSLFLGPIAAACYDVADKLLNLVSVPLAIINDSILSKAGSALFAFEKKNKSILILFIFSLSLVLPLVLTGDFFIGLFQKSEIYITKEILVILSISILFGTISNYIKIFHFVNLGKLKFINAYIFFGALFYFSLVFLFKLIGVYNHFSGVVVFLLSEILICGMFFYRYYRDSISEKIA